ncbi:unnamed protein product, partial [Didymodactylos carnosus]
MSSIPCWYGHECRNEWCTYSHPIETFTDTSQTFQSALDTPTCNRTPCKFGQNCQRLNCIFSHPALINFDNHSEQYIALSNNDRFDTYYTYSDYHSQHLNDSMRNKMFQTVPGSQKAMFRENDTNRSRRNMISQSYDTTNNSYARNTARQQQLRTVTFPRTQFNQNLPIAEIDELINSLSIRFQVHVPRVLKQHDSLIEQHSKNNVDENNNEENDQMSIDKLQNDINQDTSMKHEFDDHLLDELKSQRTEFIQTIEQLISEFHLITNALDDFSYTELQRISSQLIRESSRLKAHLPIYAHRTTIVEQVKNNQVVILKGDTGSGKSTQVVQYLCDEGLANEGQIICTQPRKLAARSLAIRVAEEYGCSIGQEIGFYVGNNRRTSSCTKVKFMTDSVFLNECLHDSMLEQYSIVIIDEVHERK